MDPRYDQTVDVGERSVRQEDVFRPHYRVVARGVDPARAETIQETYRMLAIAVFAAMAAGWLGSRSLPLIKFMLTGPGILLSFLGLNLIPAMALNVARRSPRNGAIFLAMFGGFAGLVLSPLIFLAMLVSGAGSDMPNMVQSALVLTAVVFLGISGYVWKSGSQFRFSEGIMWALFWSILGASLVNYFFLQSGWLGIAVSAGIGIFGAIGLLHATSRVLNDPEFSDPVVGALAIFAGLFNIFQAILSLLLAGGRRD